MNVDRWQYVEQIIGDIRAEIGRRVVHDEGKKKGMMKKRVENRGFGYGGVTNNTEVNWLLKSEKSERRKRRGKEKI